MAKIRIAHNPTFKADVEIPRVGAEPVKVPFEFRYLDRTQLAALFDKWNSEREALFARIEEQSLGLADSTLAETQMQAAQLKEVIVDWGFEDALCEEALLALVQTSVSVPKAVLDRYQQCYQQTRLGN
jgi:hypothetical protein